jgi:hypothetical protein
VLGGAVTIIGQLREIITAKQREIDKEFRDLTDSLGSENPGKRLASAIKIRQFLGGGYERYHEDANAILSHSLLLEPTEQVVIAMADSLAQAGKPALNEIRWVKLELASRIKLKYSEIGEHVVPGIRVTHFKILQVAKGEKKITGTLDLTGAPFRCARLLEEDLTGGRLEGINFFQADLHRTKFDGSKLKNAEFIQANLRFVSFRKSELGGADFSGADLWRTDFSQATGLSAEKFARSSWKGAIFDPDFLKSLEQRYPNEGTANERKKGREECQTIGKK